ncbi:MAG: general secretion pathway protein GspB [Gammaproteobacteria bacterium]|nr:general secretion pathway protein GspB [Gammaproteobacteria bacterium]
MRRRALSVMLLAGALCGPAARADLTDPTRPPDYQLPANTATAAQPWVLTSTLISPSRRLAVINGRVYAAGDVVGGAKIMAIEPYAVLLSRAGRTFTIRLLPGRIKRPHDNDKAVAHP